MNKVDTRSQGRSNSETPPAAASPASPASLPSLSLHSSRPGQVWTPTLCYSNATMQTNDNACHCAPPPVPTYAQAASGRGHRSNSHRNESLKEHHPNHPQHAASINRSAIAGHFIDEDHNKSNSCDACLSQSGVLVDLYTPRPVGTDGPALTTPSYSHVHTVLSNTVDQILGLFETKCEESLHGIKNSLMQFMGGEMDGIKKMKEELHRRLDIIERLERGLLYEKAENRRLQRENGNLKASSQTTIAQLGMLKSEQSECRGIIDGLRGDLAVLIEQQSQLQGGSAETTTPMLPKVADETMRDRWTQLTLEIRRFVNRHLVWYHEAARQYLGASDDSSGELMRMGLRLVSSETFALTDCNQAGEDDVLDRLTRLVLEAWLWRFIDDLVFRNIGEVWGGPAAELFSQFHGVLSRSVDPNVDMETVQKLVNLRVHGAAMIDQSIGIDSQRLLNVVSIMLRNHLWRFLADNDDQGRCQQQLTAIVRSAVELHAIFTKSRAIFEVHWPKTWSDCVTMETTTGDLKDEPGEEDDKTQVLYTCCGKSHFLAVSPAVAKRGTADGDKDRYKETIVLIQPRVIR